jgi:hypothetical protein
MATMAPAAIERALSREADAPARGGDRTRARQAHGGTPGHDDQGDVPGLVGGAGILLIQACALIPGLLPCLLVAGALALPLVLPVVALGVVFGIVVGVPLGLWRLAKALVALAHPVRRVA